MHSNIELIILNKLENLINFFHGIGKKLDFLQKIPFIDKSNSVSSGNYKPVDFCNGPAELVDSINENRNANYHLKWL